MLQQATLMNERCLDMQRQKRTSRSAAGSKVQLSASATGSGALSARSAPTKASQLFAQQKPRQHSRRVRKTGCPLLSAGAEAFDAFKDAILTIPIDVEALAKLGRGKQVCAQKKK